MAFEDFLKSSTYSYLADICVDKVNGGYVERFAWDGSPVDPGFKRVRVNARQCYVFSHAALGGNSDALKAAELGVHYLLNKCIRDDGQFVSRLTSNGKWLDPTADLYDIAFGLFAIAWWYKLSGDKKAVEVAKRSVTHINKALVSPTGAGYISREGSVSGHSQNPHMHLFEAAIFLAAFTQDPEFMDLADALFDFTTAKLLLRAPNAIPEEFDQNWVPSLDKRGSIIIEPGHQYEWAWLLSRYALLASRPTAVELGRSLYDFAEEAPRGRNGLIYDAVNETGEVVGADHRIWPHLECLKANLALAEAVAQNGASFMSNVEQIQEQLTEFFLKPSAIGPAAILPQHLWIDYLEGKTFLPKSDHIPASTLYHITLSAFELARTRSNHPPFSGSPHFEIAD